MERLRAGRSHRGAQSDRRRGRGQRGGSHARHQRQDQCGRGRSRRRRTARGRGARQGDERRRSDRAAARRAGHDQGERGSEGVRDAQRRRRLQGRDRAGRCTRGAKPPPGRGHRHRAHQHAGILLPRDHGERATRPHLQSLEHHRLGRRLLGRRGRGGDDGLWPDRARQRHRRLAPLPGLRLRRGHGEARVSAGCRPTIPRPPPSAACWRR